MSDPQIQPHKVTKPIQLVAAWLAGLIIVDGMFLGTASFLSVDSWQQGTLVIAAIVNVPIFLGAIFLLQTKFRAELQEDSFYSEYLSKRTSAVVKVDKNTAQDTRIEALERRMLELSTIEVARPSLQHSDEALAYDWSNWRIAVNDYHPEFEKIVAALAEAKIPITDTFGKRNGATRPSRWVISIHVGLPIGMQAQLLKVLLPFNFAGYQLWEPRRDAEENEDVYIGSYGNDAYARITPKLKEILSQANPETTLNAYYRSHFPRIHEAA